MRQKLFILGSAGIPAKYGGFETLAENLSIKLSDQFDVYVACSSKLYSKENRQKSWNRVNRIFIPVRPNGFQSLIYDLFSMIIALPKADFIIMLGSGSGILLPFLRIFKKFPVAVHMDGLEWKRQKWNLPAKIFLWLNFKLSLKYAKYIISDSKVLNKYIPEKYLNKVVTLSYGCDHIPDIQINTKLSNEPYALIIARAEPENNLEMIINTFQSVANLNLIIISNWKYTKYGRWLNKEKSVIPNVQMIGPIYDDKELLQQYRIGCSVYIHGHSSGGTNPSLIEAMTAGKPILAFDNDFNRITTNNMAFYFDTIETLRTHLSCIKNSEFLESGQNLRKYAEKEYSWEKVSKSITGIITLK